MSLKSILPWKCDGKKLPIQRDADVVDAAEYPLLSFENFTGCKIPGKNNGCAGRPDRFTARQCEFFNNSSITLARFRYIPPFPHAVMTR